MHLTKSVVLLILVLSAFLLGVALNPKVEATLVTYNNTYIASQQGWVSLNGFGYSNVWEAEEGSVTDNQLTIGQRYSGGDFYTIWRSFTYFDTAPIPDSATITSAILSINITKDDSYYDFNVTAQSGMPDYPHSTLLSTDYHKDLYSGTVGYRDTSEIAGLGYWNITLDIDYIAITSETKLCLRDSKDIAGTAPPATVNHEYIESYTGDALLYVSYTVAGTFLYVHGPYYEDGTVANCTVNATLQITNSASNTTLYDGRDGSADNVTYALENTPILISWNITATGLNQSRVYWIKSTDVDLYLYVPKPNDLVYQYTFSLIDFVGVTNGYLETRVEIAGTDYTVERYDTNIVNSIPFWMVYGTRYRMYFTSDQGTHDFGYFVAGSEQTQTLILTASMFNITLPSWNITVTAKRTGNSSIQIYYYDYHQLTINLTITISHWATSYTKVTDLTRNVNGYTDSYTWTDAVASRTYEVQVEANREGTKYTWQFSVPNLPSGTNPFDIFNDLGWTLPIPINNIVAVIIILVVFAIFSYATVGVGCLMGTGAAIVLTWFNWFSLMNNAAGWLLLTFAAIVSTVVAIVESRKNMYYMG